MATTANMWSFNSQPQSPRAPAQLASGGTTAGLWNFRASSASFSPDASAYPGSHIPTIEEFENPDKWSQSATTSIAKNQGKLGAYGLYTPPEPAKENWFWKWARRLSVVNAAIAGVTTALAEGRDPLQGGVASARAAWTGANQSELKYYKDTLVALGMKDRKGKIDLADVVGLALDIFADPTTYMGIGTAGKVGKGAKVLGKAERLAQAGKISAESLELLKKGAPYARTMAEQARLGQRGLINFAGRPIVKGAPVWGAAERIAPAVKALPGIRNFGKAFDVDWNLAEGVGHGGAQEFKAMRGEMFGRIDDATQQAVKEVQGILKGMPKVERETIPFIREMGDPAALAKELENPALAAPMKAKLVKAHQLWLKNPALAEKAKQVGEFFARYEEPLKKAGLLDSFVENYIPHLYPRRLQEKGALAKLFKDTGDVALAGRQGLGKAFFQGHRKYAGMMDAIKSGLVPETDIGKLMVKYAEEANKLIYNTKFVDDVMGMFGTKVGVKAAMPVVEEGTKLWTSRVFAKQLPTQELPAKWIGKNMDHLVDISDLAPNAMGKLKVVYKMPESIANATNKLFKVVAGDESVKSISGIWNTVNGMFKRYALGLPGTQIRNLQGAVWNNWLQGIASPKWYLKARYLLRKGGKELEEASKAGVLHTGQMAWEGGFRVAPGIGTAAERYGRGALDAVNPLAKGFAPIRLSNKMMQEVEDTVRLANFLYHRAKGFNPRHAALKVIESQFDYAPQAYTKFENALRKGPFPFYAWMRNNVPYQIKKFLTEPGKYAVAPKVLMQSERAGTETPEEREYRRPYFGEYLMTPIPKPIQDFLQKRILPMAAKVMSKVPGFKGAKWTHGGTMYINPNFPFQDLSKLFENGPTDVKAVGQELVGMLQPWMKLIIEGIPYVTGGKTIDLFSGRTLTDTDYVVAPLWLSAAIGLAPTSQRAKMLSLVRGIYTKDGTLKVSPMAIKTLETIAPPTMMGRRFEPPSEAVEKYYKEPGRAWDNYITRIMSNLMGVKFYLPAVEGEKRRRVTLERQRLINEYNKYTRGMGLEFEPYKRKETPQQYMLRVGGRR